MIQSIDIKKWVFAPKTHGSNPHKAGQQRVAAGIPITPSCKYVNELMTDEYVMLNWNSDKVLNLSVGDFIDQVDGGIYYIRELATPTRNSAGGYTYEQKFEAEWKFWGDTKLFYKRGIGADSGWKMTQFPKYFLDLIIETINESAWKFGEYTYEIHGEFPEMKLCDFSSGTDIISALNIMCDDEHWRTEWWVDSYNCVLHFGACVSENIVSMDEEYTKSVNRSQSQNSKGINVLYAFGGTRNISNIYRKDLIFKVQEGYFMSKLESETDASKKHIDLKELRNAAKSKGYDTAIIDGQRLLTKECFDRTASGLPQKTYSLNEKTTTGLFNGQTIKRKEDDITTGYAMGVQYDYITVIDPEQKVRVCKVAGNASVRLTSLSSVQSNINFRFDIVDADGKICSASSAFFTASSAPNETVNYNIADKLQGVLSIKAGYNACYLRITCQGGNGAVKGFDIEITNLSLILVGQEESTDAVITINGHTHSAVINPLGKVENNDQYGYRYMIAYNMDEGETEANMGDEFIIGNINKVLVPASFFSRIDDAVKAGVADNRLMLPDGIDSIESESVTIYNRKEGILILDDIYPKMDVEVTEVIPVLEQTTDQTTGVVEKWNAYRIKYEGFQFSDKYVLDGETLHIIFQTEQLAGMDFEVKFNPEDRDEASPDSQVFAIVRNNEDYGMPIPNDNIKPQPGDKFVLYGWNTDYIDDSLTPQAEQQLLQTANEVLEEMQKDQSTYDMEMNIIRCKGYSMRDWKMVKVDEEGAMNLNIGQKVEYTNSIYGSDTGDGNKLITARIRRVERGLDDLSLRYQLGVSAPYSRSRELRNLINSIK
ncbi:MAG: hypothetical protein MJZ41_07520 [Bacteroidaceae bacterium]|nr:hypothetical protein [Bacteroidaceae bacterium]